MTGVREILGKQIYELNKKIFEVRSQIPISVWVAGGFLGGPNEANIELLRDAKRANEEWLEEKKWNQFSADYLKQLVERAKDHIAYYAYLKAQNRYVSTYEWEVKRIYVAEKTLAEVEGIDAITQMSA